MDMHLKLDLADDTALDALVATGRYDSREGAVREAIRMLVEDEEQAAAALRAAIDRGLADVRAGRVVDLDMACDELEAEYEAMAAARR